MKVEELRTEGRVYRRCFSRLGTAVVGRANAGGTTTAVRKMRGRSGLARPSRSGGARGARACLCGGASWEGVFSLWRWFKVRRRGVGQGFVMSVFFGRGVCFRRGRFTRSGCAALGKVFCRRWFLAAGCVFSWGGLQGWDARFRGQVGAGGTEFVRRFRRNSKNSRESRRRDRFAGRFRLVN